jgi:hypothetical protein
VTTSQEPSAGAVAALDAALAGADPGGRLPAAGARALRAALEACRAGDASNGLRDPERLLGPFETLPPRVQTSLVQALEEDERWRLRGFELGDWHPKAVHLLKNRPVKLLTRNFSDRSASLLRNLPRSVLYALSESASRLRGRHGFRPSAGDVLRGAGLELRSLSVYYARGLAQPAGYRGFWRDPSSNVTVGTILGVDLLPTADGLWYLESNLNPAMWPARSALYEKDDPFVVNLCGFARERGYRRLVVVMPNQSRVDPVIAARWEKESAAREIHLTLLEDPFLHRPRYHTAYRVPEPLEPDTLVVRMKLYRTNLDDVVHGKRGSHRALRIYQERSPDRDVRLPPISDDPIASAYDPRQPFPNLVYKMPDRDRGNGIVFLKASSPGNARELVTREIQESPPENWSDRLNGLAAHLFEEPGFFQPYIVGSMLEGRRLYYVRAHVLLTPVGAQFLSAHRIVSGTPVPDELSDGIVRDRDAYFWKFVTGAHFALPPPEEESRVAKAALSVARGLSAAAVYGFQTQPA